MTIRTITVGLLILVSTLQSLSSNATTIHRHTATAGVDTVAHRSCLDAGLMAKLGVKCKSIVAVTTPYGMGPVHELRVRMLEIASLHVEDVSMIVMDMRPLSSASDDKLDGILGTDVLRLFPLKLEVSDGLAEPLTISDIPPGSVVVELHARHLLLPLLVLQSATAFRKSTDQILGIGRRTRYLNASTNVQAQRSNC